MGTWTKMIAALARAAAANKGSGKKLIDESAARTVLKDDRYGSVYKDAQLEAYKALQARRPGVSAERRMSELADKDAADEWDRAIDWAIDRMPYDEAARLGENRFKAVRDSRGDDYYRDLLLEQLRDKSISPADILNQYEDRLANMGMPKPANWKAPWER